MTNHDLDYYNRELPFFVYGTLRPDCGNDHCWIGDADAIADGRCWAEGFRIVGHGIPFAYREEGQRTIGTLIVPHPDKWAEVCYRLDCLESFRPGRRSHTYDRQEVAVTVDDDMPQLAAWMYVCDLRGDRFLETQSAIPGNDFKEFGYNARTYRTGGWS